MTLVTSQGLGQTSLFCRFASVFITVMCHPPVLPIPSFFGLFVSTSFLVFHPESTSPFPSLSSPHLLPSTSLPVSHHPCALSTFLLLTTGSSLLDRPSACSPAVQKARPFHLDVGHDHWLLLGPALTLHPVSHCSPEVLDTDISAGALPELDLRHISSLDGHKTSPSPNVEPDLRSPSSLNPANHNS